MKASEVLKNVEENFLKDNHFVGKFPVDYPQIWDFCLKVLADAQKMNTIIAANNSSTPVTPVETLASLYVQEHNLDASFAFGDKVDQYLGFLMGYVFKNLFHYTLLEDNKKIHVNKWGIKTAALYTDGVVTELETIKAAGIKAAEVAQRAKEEHGPYGILYEGDPEGQLWKFCLNTISNATKMNKILYQNNELDIPPVKTLLDFYQEEIPAVASKILPDNVSLGLGSLMGFVFQNILGYKIKLAYQPVTNCLGIQTAAVFCEGKFLSVEPGPTKEAEILDFIEVKFLQPIINNKILNIEIKQIAWNIFHKIKKLQAADMIKYFHNAKADATYERFEQLTARKQIAGFEAIAKEFDERFNDEWLRK